MADGNGRARINKEECFLQMTGVSWKLSMQSFLTASRTPPQITTGHEEMSRGNVASRLQGGFLVPFRDKATRTRKCSIRGSTAFLRGTAAETKHLSDKASLLQDFPSRLPTK